MTNTIIDQNAISRILMLLEEEREKALSPREWQHRIAGYGYAIKRTEQGEMITTLPHGREVCALPAQLSA
ncbi:hypothetical protein [Marinovum sp.]|uniref:hypothetical protein n=1 Tax=Marinovum sp. TaxID=2024839 RepID=UPI002B2769AA|nr:hypothetical protein [Marinovum sp.]